MRFSRPGLRRFQLKCTFSVIFCSRRHIGVLLSLLLMFLESRTKLLMLSLVSVGRSSGSWPRRLIPALIRFRSSRTVMLAFLGPGSGSFHPDGKLMRQVNASSSNFAAKLESSTPMAHLALQTSGLYVCSFHFLQSRFTILQLKFIYLQFAPCTLSKVFPTLCLIACGFNEC